MPITQTMALVPLKEGRGQAQIPRCTNCQRYVVPCKCQLIDGVKCTPPFRGLVHLDTNSHVCNFPLPGATFGEVAEK